jgi:glycosyltransferase involved in cell wall biosynthesis
VKPSESFPLVSIIIPTFNSESGIECCLKSIKEQTYPNIEIIIVDRHSCDRTVKIAEKFNARILIKNLERSAARNQGAKEAKGSFLFFIDSDMELTPNVVKECVEACRQRAADAVIILEEPKGRGLIYECRRIEKQLHAGVKFFEAPRFFKTEVFKKVGGFDEELVFGEDSELYTRIEKAGFKTLEIKSRIIHSEGYLSIRKIILKAYEYGKSLTYLIKKKPNLIIIKHLTPKTIKISNIKINSKSAMYLLILTFIKIIELEAYSIGIITRFIEKLA